MQKIMYRVLPLALGLSLSVTTVNLYAADAAADVIIGGDTTAMQSTAEKNLQAGQAFLAENKTKPGVVTLPDGLQYKILTKGDGPKPGPNDAVTVHYAGTLLDGTEFDSSYKRNQPATFPVSAVIPGWVEVLQLMPVGSTWEVYIPSNLAYGKQGAGSDIGPNETLIFKIQLLSIQKA